MPCATAADEFGEHVDCHRKVKVVGLCGSIREGSLAKQALQTALEGAARVNCEVELIDLNDLNLYFCDGLLSESKNALKGPNDVERLCQLVQDAQGIVIATPEYHSSFSGVLKNALDLMGFKEFEGKVVGLVAVSGGAMGGLSAMEGLRGVMRALHAWVVPTQCGVAQAWQNLNSDDSQKRLRKVGHEVAKYANLLHSHQAQEFLTLMERSAENPGAV